MRKPTLKEKIIAVFFPSTCFCCGDEVNFAHFLCDECKKSLDEQRVKKAKVISRNSIRYSIHSVYYYQDAAKQAVKRLKYCQATRPSKYMAEAIASRIGRLRNKEFDIVTYVPMERFEKVKRNYNPPEEIASCIAKRLSTPVHNVLSKIKHTEKQHTLSASRRRENVKGAYQASPEVAGKNVLLIDDVITTGSTICECAGELLKAGAKSVTLYTFCAAGGKSRVDTKPDLLYNDEA